MFCFGTLLGFPMQPDWLRLLLILFADAFHIRCRDSCAASRSQMMMRAQGMLMLLGPFLSNLRCD